MVWVYFIEFDDWGLLVFKISCLFYMFFMFVSPFEYHTLFVLCCAYHAHGKISHTLTLKAISGLLTVRYFHTS